MTLWEQLEPRLHPLDANQKAWQKYYEARYAVARRLAPRRICEIGVRAGYSAFALLSAAPEAYLLGIDADNGRNAGKAGCFRHALAILSGFNFALVVADTQRMRELPGHFDLVHVDGDHSFPSCRHDLRLAAAAAPTVLVDGYDEVPDVRRACEAFLEENPAWQAEYVDDSLRGTLLLTNRAGAPFHPAGPQAAPGATALQPARMADGPVARTDIHEEASVKTGARRLRDFPDIHSASAAQAARHERVCGCSHSHQRRRSAPCRYPGMQPQSRSRS
jgi:hypothetical protein